MKENVQCEQLQFNFIYGKFEDPNRQLMIKYKYDTITSQQLYELHNKLSKLIYDIIRKNYINMSKQDVYQQIWKKISKAKHSWNQNAGTKVSTWIVIVCISVINGLRLKCKKYNQRYVLYNDISSNEEDNEQIQECQKFAISNGLLNYNNFQQLYFSQQMQLFLKSLNDKQKSIVNMILTVNQDQLNQNGNEKYIKKKMTKNYLYKKSGMKQKQFQKQMIQIQQRFNEIILNKEYKYVSKKD